MTDLQPDADGSERFTRLRPAESPTEQIGFGLAGIVLFTLFGCVAYSASGELDGVAAFAAFGASLVFFLLAAAALYGTVHVSLASRVTAPILELESLELTRGCPVAARLVQRGPASFKELSVLLVCTKTEFEEATQETRRSLRDEVPYETESVSLNRGETQLAKIPLFAIEGLRVAHRDEVVHSFTISVPDDATPTGGIQVSEFVTDSYDWQLIVEAEIFGPNPKQEYDVSVV